MTSVPQNKTELTEAIESNYQKLRADLIDIPGELAREKELDGHAKGTTMSVCDLVAYLVGWGNLVLKWHRGRNKGLSVDFPETGYNWGELGKLAQKFYADYKDDDYEILLKKLEATKNDILTLIGKYNNHQLYEAPWYRKATMGKMIQLNTSSPYRNARNRIRRWKKQKV